MRIQPRTNAQKFRIQLACTVAFASLAATGGAVAQEIEELTVTARRTEETIIGIPLSVAAFSSEDLQNRGIRDLNDISDFSPGFHRQSQSVARNDRGFNTLAMRGVSAGVGVFVDGAPVNGANLPGLMDYERVEVVKGPQSAYFGRGTFSGAINFITRAPSEDFSTRVDLRYERFNSIDVTGAVEGPIVPGKLSARLSGRVYHTDGSYEDAAYPDVRLGNRNTRSISATLEATPTDALKVRVYGVRWTDSDGLPANGRLGPGQFNCNPGAAQYICGEIGEPPRSSQTWQQSLPPLAYNVLTNAPGYFQPGFLDHLGITRRGTQARVLVDYDLNDWHIGGIGSYGEDRWGFMQTLFSIDVRNLPNPNYASNPTGLLPQVYQNTSGNNVNHDRYLEARVDSPATNRLHGSLGFNFFYGRTQSITRAFTVTGYQLSSPPAISKNYTKSVFGALAYDFTDQLSLNLEGRYQVDDTQEIRVSTTTANFSATFKAFAPRAIVQYKPNADTTVYVSYSEGTRPGTFNTGFFSATPFVQAQLAATGVVPPIVPQDKMKMWELGYKAQLFDNRLRILAAAYYGKWVNRPITSIIPYYPTPTSQVLANLTITAPNGAVNLHGAEFQADFAMTENLTLSGTFAIADTDIRKTYCSDCLAVSGNPFPVGTQLPGYSKYTGTFSATYEHELATDYKGHLRGDVVYASKIYDSEGNFAWTPASAILNLRAGVTHSDYLVELYVNNVFDSRAPIGLNRSVINTYAATGAVVGSTQGLTVSLRQPATYGIRLSAKF